MSTLPEALWLNVSPSLQQFDQPLLRHLSKQVAIGRWEYYQTQDEACCLEIALTLLHDYLKHCAHPVHLFGHSTGGLLALLYTRRHPQRVKSLSLLSVGVHPAVDWQAHYYVHRQLLSCRREAILTQMAHYLFGRQTEYSICQLMRLLEQDLENSLSPHSLFRRVSIASGNVSPPLLVCRGEEDIVIDLNQLNGWQSCLKPSDRLWQCPQGSYFFHFLQPEAVAQQLLEFWATVPSGQLSLVSS